MAKTKMTKEELLKNPYTYEVDGCHVLGNVGTIYFRGEEFLDDIDEDDAKDLVEALNVAYRKGACDGIEFAKGLM